MKKFLKSLIIIILIILFAFIIFVSVDYFRYKEHKKTIFALFPVTAMDGGTTEYWGLGYKIVYFNRLDEWIWKERSNIKYIGPIWVDYDDAHKIAVSNLVGETYETLQSNTKLVYLSLLNHYEIEKVEELFKEKKNNEINYYYKLMEACDEKILTDEEKDILTYEIEDYYLNNMSTMEKDAKGKFDVFLFGFDYSNIDY